ncbi:MAG: hypothetical protein ACREDR_01380 [Blastocatellia bacterium]
MNPVKSRGISSTSTVVLLLVILIVAAVGYTVYHRKYGRLFPQAGSGLPVIAEKPKPREVTFRGCPPGGDGGDRDLNLLKNRVDEGNYQPVGFDAVEKLPWPKTAERTHRSRWSYDDTEYVSRFEGLPISVEGYLAGAREEGPESPNCHGADPADRDFHIWLVSGQSDDRDSSIVVEATPRIRASHPAWTVESLDALVHGRQKVRISGWLMLDPEHPDQVGKTRGTIWEIHPIMKIEYMDGAGWTNLDSSPPETGDRYEDSDSNDNHGLDRRGTRSSRRLR